MPAIPKKRCGCGCGQAPAETTRQKLCECFHGHKVRMSREVIELGYATCACGSELIPVCLFDRAHLPGQAGDEAWGEFAAKHAIHEVLSERAKKAAVTRNRRRQAGWYRPLSEIPF